MCHCHLTAALGVHVSQGHGKWPVRVNLSICPPFDSLSCQHSWEHLSAPRHPSGVSLPLHGVARPELQRSCRHSGASIRSPVILTRLNQWEADNLHVTKTEDLMLLFGSNCIYIYVLVRILQEANLELIACLSLSRGIARWSAFFRLASCAAQDLEELRQDLDVPHRSGTLAI